MADRLKNRSYPGRRRFWTSFCGCPPQYPLAIKIYHREVFHRHATLSELVTAWLLAIRRVCDGSAT